MNGDMARALNELILDVKKDNDKKRAFLMEFRKCKEPIIN